MRIREQANHKDKRGFFNTCPFLLILLSIFPFSAPLKSRRNKNTLQNLPQIHVKPTTHNQNPVSNPLRLKQVFSVLTAYFVQNCLLILSCFSRIKNKAPVLKRVLRMSVFLKILIFEFSKIIFYFFDELLLFLNFLRLESNYSAIESFKYSSINASRSPSITPCTLPVS